MGKRITRRQQEVLGLILKGWSNKEIAAALNISEIGVKVHVSRLLRAFEVENRRYLILKVLESKPER